MIRVSISRPVAISMLYLTIAALGIAAARNMPIELLPDTDLPRLTVMSSWSGSSPEVVEAFLTSPIEAAIQQVRGVEKVISTSSAGSTRIEVTFARETDMDFARLELSERLGSLEGELPVGSRAPTVSPYVPEEFKEQYYPILTYQISGPYLLEYLRQHIDDQVVPDLQQVDGVGNVTVNGGRARVLEIELNELKIQSLGLRISDVSQRIRELEIVRQAGAVFDDAGLLRTLAVRMRPESADEIRKVPVLVDRGRVVRVEDVARVYDTFEEPTSHSRVNGFPSVTISVYKAPRTNTVAMADAVVARMETLEAVVAPGIRMRLLSNQSLQIRKQLSDLRNRAAIAAVIVLLVLLVFLRSWRAAIIVFSTVAFAVLVTINVIYFGGLTLNLLTLMGLAMGFGLIVDNAIVVLENIYRRRRLGEPALAAAEHGAREVVIPILAATGTTVVVLVPFVYLQGNLRIYYMPLAIVVGLSLIASLFVAFTFIPSLGAKLLGRMKLPPGTVALEHDPAGPRRLPPMQRTFAARLYGGMIRGTLRMPWVTVITTILLFGGSYYLFDKYVSRGRVWGGGWGTQSSYLSIQIQQQRGEELEQTDILARFFEEKLKVMPEVERFETNVSADRGTILVYFPEEYENTDIPLAVKEQMYQYSLGWGGADVRVYGYGPSFYGGGGSAPNYTIQVLGYNYDYVREIAEGIGERLKRFSRVRDVDTNSTGRYTRDKVTELVLDIDRARLAMHDLSARDVVDQVGAAVRGRTTQARQQLVVGGEERQFAVKLDGYQTMDMHQLNELLLPARTGEFVRLGDVATLRERNVLTSVRRENQQYERSVSYEFRGPQKLGDRNRDQVVNATFLPPGYSIKATQGFSFGIEEKKQIYGVLAVSVLLVFMVTAAVFESLKLPLCVLLTVPMALIGVFMLFFYTGASFTREAYVGVIMMGGIVVNSSILLVDHVNQLRRRYGLPLAEALERGTLERVRPIMMTSLTTICGLLPLVMFSKTADANIWNALAYTLIGGLSSSMILVLTVTPALYLLFERRAERRRVAATADTAIELNGAPVPA